MKVVSRWTDLLLESDSGIGFLFSEGFQYYEKTGEAGWQHFAAAIFSVQEYRGAAPYDYTQAKDAADDLDYSPEQYDDFELLEPEDFLKP